MQCFLGVDVSEWCSGRPFRAKCVFGLLGSNMHKTCMLCQADMLPTPVLHYLAPAAAISGESSALTDWRVATLMSASRISDKPS